MALKIVWSRKALSRFNEIIAHLEKEFGEKTASTFVRKVYDTIFAISIFPELGSQENKEYSIRGLVILQQVTLLYQIRKSKIILLNFYDNRQKPGSKRF
jgi:plasmid stabilization system protein ParE